MPDGSHEAVRADAGIVIAPVSNQRGASGGFELSCWNGELVRITFAIDTHDREIMAWVATSGRSISGEIRCCLPAPPVAWTMTKRE